MSIFTPCYTCLLTVKSLLMESNLHYLSIMVLYNSVHKYIIHGIHLYHTFLVFCLSGRFSDISILMHIQLEFLGFGLFFLFW